jgi:Flp pilus assembly pilin Flp
MILRSVIIRLVRDNTAASAIEYGLILSGISLGILLALYGLANGIGAVWATVSQGMTDAASSSSG